MNRTKKGGVLLQVNRTTATEYEIRTETLDEKEYLVFPVVLIKEGVHYGSHGPILHVASELSKFTDAWNGIPVVLEHPKVGGVYVSANIPNVLEEYGVGRVFNVHMKDNALVGEVWIDATKMGTLSQQALSTLMSKQPMDVSVGVFNDEKPSEGEFEGEQYIAIASNYRPDHLALLPNDKGACSWEDGCGIRVNLQFSSSQHNFATEGQKQKNMKQKNENPIIQVNVQDYQTVLQAIRNAIYSMDGNGVEHYIEAVYDGYVIYRKVDSTGETFWKQNYSSSDAGISLEGEPVKVAKKIEYVTVNKSNQKGGNKMKQELIDKLIQANVGYTDDDRNWLKNVPDDAFGKLEPKTVQVNTEITREKALEVLSLQKEEDYLALMPENMRKQFEAGIQLNKAKREALIGQITANAANVWTKEELEKMETPMLEKLAKTAKIEETVDYSLNGGRSVQVNTGLDADDILPPTGVELETK